MVWPGVTTTQPLKIVSEPLLLMEKNVPCLLKAKEYEKVSLHHVFPVVNVHCIWVLLLPPGCVSQELHVASPGTWPAALGTEVGEETQDGYSLVTPPPKLYLTLQMGLASPPPEV